MSSLHVYPERSDSRGVGSAELRVHVNTIDPSPVKPVSGQGQMLSTCYVLGTSVVVRQSTKQSLVIFWEEGNRQ